MDNVLGNDIVFTPSINVIPFSKYLSFHLSVVLVHAYWVNLIIIFEFSFKMSFSIFQLGSFVESETNANRFYPCWNYVVKGDKNNNLM